MKKQVLNLCFGRRPTTVLRSSAIYVNNNRSVVGPTMFYHQQQPQRFFSTTVVSQQQQRSSSMREFSTPNAPEYPQGKSKTFFIRVPPVGPGQKITLDKIVRNQGEFVEEDDIVCLINVEGHKIEITSPEGAFLKSMHHREGDVLRSGDNLFEMAYAMAVDEIPASQQPYAAGPVEHMRGVMNDMSGNPIKMKKTVESFARASSLGWSLIGGAVVIGLILNYFNKKHHQATPSKTQTSEKKSH